MSILGIRGTGKSKITRHFVKQCPRYFIVDPLHEYGDLGGVFKSYKSVIKALTEPKRKWNRIIFQPLEISINDFNSLMYWLFRYHHDFVLVIEEIGNYCSPRSIPPALSMIGRLGRHKGIGLIAVSQRAVHVHSDILSQSETIISFRQELPQDIKYLKEFLGEKAELARELPDYYYIAKANRQFLGVFPPIPI